MKKNLWFAALALAAMTSCSNDEVMDVAENRAIEFKSFVNNGTRALEEDVVEKGFESFAVFGSFQSNESWASVFNNVTVSKIGSTWTPEQTAYWEKNKDYNFGAYADGKNAKNDDVTFNAGDYKLTFTNYAAGDKDLVAAVTTGQKWEGAEGTTPSAVGFTFNHMLAKVKFTFKTESAETYGLGISNLKITSESGAVKTATGTYNGTDLSWDANNGQKGDYVYGNIEDFATNQGLTTGEFVYMYVIPQTNTELKATFTVTPTNQEGKKLTAVNYTASLKYDTDATWDNGKVYNYTAIINYDEVIEEGEGDKLVSIKFDNISVSGWDSDTEINSDPTVENNQQ